MWALVKSIILVDWENLVFRYQDMLKNSNLTANPNNIHIEDVFIRNNSIASNLFLDIFRIKYFTSATWDDDKIFDIKKQIWWIDYKNMTNFYTWCQINPYVYKKPKKNEKLKVIDISLAVEAMRMAYLDSIDVIYIISGDGDFIELYSDLMKRWKQVYVWSLSEGLNSEVPHIVDNFIDLDQILFQSPELNWEIISTDSIPPSSPHWLA